MSEVAPFESVLDLEEDTDSSLESSETEEEDSESDVSDEESLQNRISDQEGEEYVAFNEEVLKRDDGTEAKWTDDAVDEMVDVLCEEDRFKDWMLSGGINDHPQDAKMYARLITKVKERSKAKGQTYDYSFHETRNKVRDIVYICQEASLKIKTPIEIYNYVKKEGYSLWFSRVFPHVQSRFKSQVDQAIEPSSLGLNRAACDQNAPGANAARRRKRKRNEQDAWTNSVTETLLACCKKLAESNPMSQLIEFQKEQAELDRQHREAMLKMGYEWQQKMQTLHPQAPFSHQTTMPNLAQLFQQQHQINANYFRTGQHEFGSSSDRPTSS